jgi:hypothetical protein
LKGHFKEESLKTLGNLIQDKNSKVVGSINAKLVSTFIDEAEGSIFTIDSNSLIRVWSLKTGECLRSYPIE